MNYSLRMGGVECVRDLDREFQQVISLQRSRRNAVLKSQPLKVLHSDERPSVRFVDVVDGADICMVQRRGSAGLALKTFQRLAVAGQFIWEDFLSYGATQVGVL